MQFHATLWFWRAALALALAGTLSSSIFLVLAVIGGISFRRNRNDRGSFAPPVSILKPVHGLEESLDEKFRSFFALDYPSFELIFCARSLNDPAIVVAQAVARDFPQVPVRFIASGEPVWANPKLFSMALMAEAAIHELVLFSDSDVCVERHYLRSVIQPMADPNVGLVTCAFRGRSAGGMWSVLTALSQTVEFSSGVFTANLLEGMKFGLGPTLLTRKKTLLKIGGLASIQDLLADDFWLGFRTAEAGETVVLSSCVIDHFVSYQSLGASFRHQLGWMKNTRRSRPAGHLGTGLTYAVPFGLIGLLAASMLGHGTLGYALLAAACCNRWIQAIAAGIITQDKNTLRFFWVHPLTDLIGFVTWSASYFDSTIFYRGELYRIMQGGRIERVG